jgi:hypothetical protein
MLLLDRITATPQCSALLVAGAGLHPSAGEATPFDIVDVVHERRREAGRSKNPAEKEVAGKN